MMCVVLVLSAYLGVGVAVCFVLNMLGQAFPNTVFDQTDVSDVAVVAWPVLFVIGLAVGVSLLMGYVAEKVVLRIKKARKGGAE